MRLLTKKLSKPAPLLIIKKEVEDSNIKEYLSIEEAISDLENDPNVSAEKIKKLRSTLKNLKNKTSIKIRNGEIIK
jgi:hypothetical protein